jgi:hypothetical protein
MAGKERSVRIRVFPFIAKVTDRAAGTVPMGIVPNDATTGAIFVTEGRAP